MRVLINFVTLIIIFILTNILFADEWPRWRGPSANGISVETGWNPNALNKGPEKVWETNVGLGHSSFAIRGKYLYTMGNVDSKDIIYCLDATTGKEYWRFSYECSPGSYSGPRATPTLDDDYVYTLSREGHLHCLNASTGQLIWKKHIEKDFGAESPTWGFATSPFIMNEMLLLNACKKGIALNKKTGETIWASQSGVSGYASPTVINLNGKMYGLFFGATKLYGVDLESGNEIWSYPWQTKHDVNASDPLVIGQQIFITSGYKTGCALLKLIGNTPELVWKNKNISNHFGGGIFYEGYIYGSDGFVGKSRSKLTCIDSKSGALVWSEKIGFNSLILADKKLIILNEKGKLIIANATHTGLEEVSSAQVLPKTIKCWTAPILVNGKIYCRNTEGDIVCINVKS